MMSYVRSFLPVLILGVATPVVASAKPPVGHLRASPKPNFREGHTLLPLTRWGWQLPLDATIELAENWGYALEFGEINSRTAAALQDADSRASKLAALAASDPSKYPLSVLVHRACLTKTFREGLPESAWARDESGTRPDGKAIWSPLAPDEVFQDAARQATQPIETLRRIAPIAMLLNGGEYALSVPGHHRKYWEKDPAVVKARGDTPWFDFISRAKLRQERIISDAVRDVTPNRLLYIYYYTAGCPHRNRYGHWHRWAWDYATTKHISDIPNSSIYYKHFNSGWTGKSDMLTQTLNTVGRNIELGEHLSYNWLCGGWTRKKMGNAAFSDLKRYAGYLKCYYTAGMVGGVAGYFAYPEGGFKADTGEEIPHWLSQMMILSRVHALFSHVENLLRNGHLVPGPDRHRWSKDQPAYELPSAMDRVRVVARKHTKHAQWLVTVWATEGPETNINVTVPELDPLTLLARPEGSVYHITRHGTKREITLLDTNGLLPTEKKPTITIPKP